MGTRANKIETACIHAGKMQPLSEGAINTPVFQSSTFEYTGQSSYHDLRYIRLNNTPNHTVLHNKLAVLENGEAALVTGSGMAAISAALLTMLKAGDHLIAQNCLYGGTQTFVSQDLPNFGIEVTFIDANDPSSWAKALRPNTRVFYSETMTNPTLEVADHEGIVRFAKEHNLISIIDNTFASPINFRPLELGYTLSVHSCTKYLNGHSDIVAGAVIGSAHHIEEVTHKLNHLGGSLDPHACFLLERGIKTTALRVRYQNQSALMLARFLSEHHAVSKVNYPGLVSHPHYARAKKLFEGCSGVLSFELRDGLQAAQRFLEKVQLPVIAPSLGGVETLAILPARSSHAGIPKADRESMGIGDGLVRISVGIEATDDLITDFDQALR